MAAKKKRWSETAAGRREIAARLGGVAAAPAATTTDTIAETEPNGKRKRATKGKTRNRVEGVKADDGVDGPASHEQAKEDSQISFAFGHVRSWVERYSLETGLPVALVADRLGELLRNGARR